MENIALNTKILFFLSSAIIFTVCHLFAFFTFKHKVHTARRSLNEYSRLIQIQERDMEYKNIETTKFKGIENLKQFITLSNFEKITPSKVAYVAISKNSLEVNNKAIV